MWYPDSFGINGYYYCKAMKAVLQALGVTIYEDTPVTAVDHNKVITPYGTIKAKYIVVCADYGALNLGNLSSILYHVQTFLMVSAPLSDVQVKKIFPSKLYMVWDTDLIYHYYRLIEGNRLMLGGASLWYTYAQEEKHNNWYNARLLQHYFQKKFPDIAITFPYIWPGMLGITKDILPIAGFDQHIPSVYYVAAATGLPWAAALGTYSVDCILHGDNRFDQYFSPYRHNTLGAGIQAILGTKLTFALSHFLRVGSL
jgi:gamma-glutamylputrescine oxidase